MADEPAPAPGDAPAPRAGILRWRLWLPKAVFESTLIVLSVFLGLALGNWNSERSTDRQVAEVRRFFAEEIAENCATLQSATYLPHHRRLQGLAQSGGDVIAAATETGLHPMLFRDAVWRSAAAGDLLQEMEPREVFAVATVYRLQEELAEMNRSMYPLLLGAGEAGGLSNRSVRLYLGDVVGLEGSLPPLYAKALQEFEAPKSLRSPCEGAAVPAAR